MQSIRTLEDLIHAVTNSLSLISSHSQYLLAKHAVPGPASEDLGIICDEVERAARLLSLVPRELARANIQAAVDPPRQPARCTDTQGATRHEKTQR